MKFAHFSHVWAKPGMTPHQRYEELWRELILCDGLGYDYSFCVEHHFRPDESWISSPSLYAVGAAARTKNLRIGPMGYIVPLYHPLRLVEEIAIVDQMMGGRMELGLVPGISPDYFKPFGLDYGFRKSPTLEFVDYMRAAFGETQPFSFHGDNHHTDSAQISVQPMQKPHPPLWMMSRDPQTLEFCAANGINPGYFLVYPRADAAPRYKVFLENWQKAGWPRKPNIAYCTIVYVDESDDKAMDVALQRAARAYEGFLPPPKPGETFEERVKEYAKRFIGRGEPGASEIMANLFDPEYLIKNELVFIGSPKTVAEKIHKAAETGLFNVFMGEFSFTDLPEADLMRSIRLFGEQVIPALRGYEPF
ncbi:MAG TPA: LLM class flavin-dependent oxidoreductase [Tepidisphaeraceae bacterium]|nr:LLM class flavin-dependent oxidoreductase [Tepidisphaeraceae bacterium]